MLERLVGFISLKMDPNRENLYKGESTSEDSDVFKIERTPTDSDVFKIERTPTPNPKTSGLDITISDMSFEKTATEIDTAEILGKKDGVLNIENLDGSPSLPSQNHNHNNTDNGNKTSTKNSELLTYSRRKHNSKESNPDPLQGHESELREEPNSFECPGSFTGS
ncbi:hypothetical protein F2P56_026956 [Juglans regia]|uniref:Uncharacterized protein n=1 Tax=Juglans regia TaxID=51240 RepID=A0A833WYV1_JUGRE|nr:hypothetical protein F2P56_026956 [Juglans regia]